jgi:YjbE family integral membrane protein
MLDTFMHMLGDPAFWAAAGSIIMIDILLGGDNAILIALACRNLPPQQRKKGVLWGTAGAIVLRIVLITFALSLLTVPYIKLVGGVLLLWIGVKLLTDEGDHGEVAGKASLWGAVQTIIIADLLMSVDNVLGIAGAAQGAQASHQLPLVVFGLLVSVPIIIWGSKFVIVLMEKFPLIITAGAALLGWLAGGMIVTDPAVNEWFTSHLPHASLVAGFVGAALVVLVGWLILKKSKQTIHLT